MSKVRPCSTQARLVRIQLPTVGGLETCISFFLQHRTPFQTLIYPDPCQQSSDLIRSNSASESLSLPPVANVSGSIDFNKKQTTVIVIPKCIHIENLKFRNRTLASTFVLVGCVSLHGPPKEPSRCRQFCNLQHRIFLYRRQMQEP